MCRARLLAVLVAAGLCTAHVSAQPPTVEEASPIEEILGRALEVEGDDVALSLEDAIAISLQRNLGLRIQRLDRETFRLGIMGATGIYDLGIGAIASATDSTEASASNLDGADISVRETQALNLQLDQLVPTGGVASIDWQNSRLKSNSFFATINPSFDVEFNVAYSQPLLRDFGRRITERSISIARTNSGISARDLELAVIDTIREVERAYWQLVEAQAQLEVSEESLSLAEQLHEMNRVQVEVGTLAPLELIQSEAGIATRQEEIIRAQALVEDSEDVLRQLLNLETDRYWLYSIQPSTDPEMARVEIDLEDSLAVAYEFRPEIARQELQLTNLELDERFFRNQRLPGLDFQISYGYNGVGGDVRDLAPGESPFDPDAEFTTIEGGYSDALDQVLDRDFDGWNASLIFSYPLQNRAARARYLQSQLALESGLTRLDELKLAIRTEVRRTARAVETAARQIDSARVSRRLQEENLDAEEKRYENGLSTSFQVLEIQEDLSAARSREVSSITNYRRALLAYWAAIGRLLEEKGVDIEDDPASDM